MVSVSGSKVISPANAQAVTNSGLVTKACVPGFPSFRLAKFRLYEVKMELSSPCFSWRFHWPIQGPHALARTVPPAVSNSSVIPSLSMVARTCSEPGVMRKGTLLFSPAAKACLTRSAHRDISSYELLVQDPIKPALISLGHPFASQFAAISAPAMFAKSGVKGPLSIGFRSLRLISMISSYSHPASALRFSLKPSAAEARASRFVAFK
mmetsp:Transcript_22641/g.29632  ORF Transcript_22641/g.29632 Transcript_22641/m.29632 type:complete len:209 (+) Transcript_22641:680-1306(+)